MIVDGEAIQTLHLLTNMVGRTHKITLHMAMLPHTMIHDLNMDNQ